MTEENIQLLINSALPKKVLTYVPDLSSDMTEGLIHRGGTSRRVKIKSCGRLLSLSITNIGISCRGKVNPVSKLVSSVLFIWHVYPEDTGSNPTQADFSFFNLEFTRSFSTAVYYLLILPLVGFS